LCSFPLIFSTIDPIRLSPAASSSSQTLPRFDAKGAVVPVTLMNASFSGDHRVIDGATCANFSNAFKRYLEQPALMLAGMR
jgi:2-oxoisovalerate dehydrogenase E2 component (dihydrolipoyl transacylase)